MKKSIFAIAMMLTAVSASAQEVKVAEPEFINSYCILTSDSTFATLPKESGTIGKHQNKVSKWSKIIGGAADIVGAGGMIGAATAGSVGGVINGVRVMGGAAGVANAAGTVSSLVWTSFSKEDILLTHSRLTVTMFVCLSRAKVTRQTHWTATAL